MPQKIRALRAKNLLYFVHYDTMSCKGGVTQEFSPDHSVRWLVDVSKFRLMVLSPEAIFDQNAANF